MNYQLLIEHCAFTAIIFLTEANSIPLFNRELSRMADLIKGFSDDVKDFSTQPNNYDLKEQLIYKINLLNEYHQNLPSDAKESILLQHSTYKKIWEGMYGSGTYFYFFDALPNLKNSLNWN